MALLKDLDAETPDASEGVDDTLKRGGRAGHDVRLQLDSLFVRELAALESGVGGSAPATMPRTVAGPRARLRSPRSVRSLWPALRATSASRCRGPSSRLEQRPRGSPAPRDRNGPTTRRRLPPPREQPRGEPEPLAQAKAPASPTGAEVAPHAHAAATNAHSAASLRRPRPGPAAGIRAHPRAAQSSTSSPAPAPQTHSRGSPITPWAEPCGAPRRGAASARRLRGGAASGGRRRDVPRWTGADNTPRSPGRVRRSDPPGASDPALDGRQGQQVDPLRG